MHFNIVMLDSDMDRVEEQKKSGIWTKSQDCKHDLQKYSIIKNSEELLKWNEEMVLPLFGMIWSCE